MYSAEWRKPAPKGNILYDSIYRTIWKRKHSRLGERICGCQDGGGGGVDSRGMRGGIFQYDENILYPDCSSYTLKVFVQTHRNAHDGNAREEE